MSPRMALADVMTTKSQSGYLTTNAFEWTHRAPNGYAAFQLRPAMSFHSSASSADTTAWSFWLYRTLSTMPARAQATPRR